MGTTDVLNLKAVFSGKNRSWNGRTLSLIALIGLWLQVKDLGLFGRLTRKTEQHRRDPKITEGSPKIVKIVSFEVFIVTMWSRFTSGCWSGALRHRWLSKNSSPGISGLSFVFLVVDSWHFEPLDLDSLKMVILTGRCEQRKFGHSLWLANSNRESAGNKIATVHGLIRKTGRQAQTLLLQRMRRQTSWTTTTSKPFSSL